MAGATSIVWVLLAALTLGDLVRCGLAVLAVRVLPVPRTLPAPVRTA